jgi:hypothetical protein
VPSIFVRGRARESTVVGLMDDQIEQLGDFLVVVRPLRYQFEQTIE